MLTKSWGPALSTLLITVLVAVGVVTTVTPAQAAVSVSYNNTGVVRAGSTNTEDFIVNLSGLAMTQDVLLTFTGVTIKYSSSYSWSAFTTGTAPSYNLCPIATVQYSTGIGTSGGSCLVDSPGSYIQWYANTSQNVGGTFSVKFPPGSLTFAGSGSYSVEVKHNGTVQSTQSLNTLIPQSALSLTSGNGTFGTPLALTTSGGSGTGAISYSAANGTATGCAVTGANLSSTSAGTCLITATKAADSTYSPISSTQTTVTLAKATRTLSFGSTTTYTLAYGATQTVTATPSAGSSDGVITYSVSSGTACTVNASSGEIRATTSSGSCTVSASIAQGTNYLAASTTTQVIVNGTVKAITITGGSPTVIYGGTAFNPTALDIAGALVGTQQLNSSAAVYTYTGFNGTSYGPTTIRPTDAGWYRVLPSNVSIETPAHVDTTANYNISYASGSLEIRRASRTISFSTTSYTVAYGDTQSVSASASTGDGAISYSAGSSTACSVDSATGVVTVTAATGTCEISSTVAQDTNYLTATTTTPVTITVTTRAITVTANAQAFMVGGTVNPGYALTSGTLAGFDAISGITYRYAGTGATTYASSATAPSAIGTYSITPSAAVFSTGLAANYTVTYATGVLTINNKTSRTVTFLSTSYTVQYGDTKTVAAIISAGASQGALTYSAGSSTACSVDATTGLVTVSAATGSCSISATIAETTTYQSATSTTPVTITVAPRAITVTADDKSVAYAGTVTPSYTISSGTLAGSDAISAVSYRYSGTGGSTYASSATPPTGGGTYSITPSAAIFSTGVASNYAVTYAPGTLVIAAGTPTVVLTLSAASGASILGATLTITANGLKSGAAYDVVMRSTPITLANGSAPNGIISSSALIPSTVGAGWHTITFSSTSADGSVFTHAIYVKVSASGVLLQQTETIPAELAYTGFELTWQLSLSFLLLALGAVLMSMCRVMRKL
jgi:hypothetical protein